MSDTEKYVDQIVEKGSFKQMLQDMWIEGDPNPVPQPNKLEFLGQSVFDFDTYDSRIDEVFAKNMIEVLQVILNGTTYEYHGASEENYLNYLRMVNMPFLKNKLGWGVSIRGAWLETSDYGRDEPYYDIMWSKIRKKDFREFISDLLEWAQEEPIEHPDANKNMR